MIRCSKFSVTDRTPGNKLTDYEVNQKDTKLMQHLKVGGKSTS